MRLPTAGGIQLHGLLEWRNRFCIFLLVAQRHSQCCQSPRAVGINLRGFFQNALRFCPLVLFQIQHTLHIKHVWIIGSELHRLVQGLLRFIQFAVSQGLHALVQGLPGLRSEYRISRCRWLKAGSRSMFTSTWTLSGSDTFTSFSPSLYPGACTVMVKSPIPFMMNLIRPLDADPSSQGVPLQ